MSVLFLRTWSPQAPDSPSYPACHLVFNNVVNCVSCCNLHHNSVLWTKRALCFYAWAEWVTVKCSALLNTCCCFYFHKAVLPLICLNVGNNCRWFYTVQSVGYVCVSPGPCHMFSNIVLERRVWYEQQNLLIPGHTISKSYGYIYTQRLYPASSTLREYIWLLQMS